MAIFYGVLMTFFCLVCLILIAIILLQPHQGEGLAGVFGGGGGESFFGAKSISTAVWITSVLAGIYMILAVSINKLPAVRSASVLGGAGTDSSSSVVAPPATPPAGDEDGN